MLTPIVRTWPKVRSPHQRCASHNSDRSDTILQDPDQAPVSRSSRETVSSMRHHRAPSAPHVSAATVLHGVGYRARHPHSRTLQARRRQSLQKKTRANIGESGETSQPKLRPSIEEIFGERSKTVKPRVPPGVLRDSLRRGTQKVEGMESYTEEGNKEGITCLKLLTFDSPLL